MENVLLDQTYVASINMLKQILLNWTITHKIPSDHGFDHYCKVYDHSVGAILENEKKLSPHQQYLILVASLLHDVDDHKIALSTKIMSEVGMNLNDQESVIEIVDLVSCSKNGNGIVEHQHLWKLIPRDSDRLEALGQIGVDRCYDYTKRKGFPLVAKNTPLPTSREELEEVMKRRTLEEYVTNKGNSESMIDHYYDKLLHLDVLRSENPYLVREAKPRMDIMIEFLLSFNRKIKQMRENFVSKNGSELNLSQIDIIYNLDDFNGL
eukprot:gene10454-14042_t